MCVWDFDITVMECACIKWPSNQQANSQTPDLFDKVKPMVPIDGCTLESPGELLKIPII